MGSNEDRAGGRPPQGGEASGPRTAGSRSDAPGGPKGAEAASTSRPVPLLGRGRGRGGGGEERSGAFDLHPLAPPTRRRERGGACCPEVLLHWSKPRGPSPSPLFEARCRGESSRYWFSGSEAPPTLRRGKTSTFT